MLASGDVRMSQVPDMDDVVPCLHQVICKTRRLVLVEQEPHAG